MLPNKCANEPCRNIEVKTVAQGATQVGSSLAPSEPKITSGVAPNPATIAPNHASPDDHCQRKTSTQAPIRVQVTQGVMRVGLSSWTGIMATPARGLRRAV